MGVDDFRIVGYRKRKPFDKKVVRVDVWYDRHTRLWVIQRKNKKGHQVGDADFEHYKEDALKLKAKYMKRIRR